MAVYHDEVVCEGTLHAKDQLSIEESLREGGDLISHGGRNIKSTFYKIFKYIYKNYKNCRHDRNSSVLSQGGHVINSISFLPFS